MNIFAPDIFDQIADEWGAAGADAFLRELQTGMRLEQGRIKQKTGALAEVHHNKSGAIDGFGAVTSSIPPEIWHSWNQKYPGFWNDDTNRQWFLRNHPQFKVGYQGKIRMAWKPTLDRTQGGIFIGSKYGNARN